MVVKEGYRWKLVGGANIALWSESWLRLESNLFIETPLINDVENKKVENFIDATNRCWNIDIINQILCHRDAHPIMKMPSLVIT